MPEQEQKQTDIFADIEDAAEKDQENKTIDLGLISRLVEKQVLLESKFTEKNTNMIYNMVKEIKGSIADLEEAIKLRKKDLFAVRQVQIPEVMKEFGLQSIETDQGNKIEIKKGLSVSVKDVEGLHKYMREHEAGDLIKDLIVVAVDNEEARKEVNELLDKIDCMFERKTSVHSATLKKYIKDNLEKGVSISDALVNVFEYEYSKLK